MSGAPWGKNRPFFVFRTATKLVLSRLYSFAPPLSQRRRSQAVASFHGNAARDANSRSAEKPLTDRCAGRPRSVGQLRKLATNSSLLGFFHTNYLRLNNSKTFLTISCLLKSDKKDFRRVEKSDHTRCRSKSNDAGPKG